MNQVEERPIKEYRLLLFTVFNSAVLTTGAGEFKYFTDDEATNELEDQIEYYKSKGFFKDARKNR